MRPRDVTPGSGAAAPEDGGELSATDRVERAIEEQEFSRGHIAPGEEPVEPLPAATVCLARSSDAGFEVLLLKRPLESRFAAGAYVFPGGRVDAEDEDAALLQRLRPQGPQEPEALIAGLREVFEETAILLATSSLDQDLLNQARDELIRGELDFRVFLERNDLLLDAASAVYFSRWITPIQLTRRYDTRFFLAEHRGAEPELTEEHTAYEWLAPRAALARFADGELPMLFPTRKTLELLQRFRSLEEVFDTFRARVVKPILARLIVQGDRVVPAPIDDDEL